MAVATGYEGGGKVERVQHLLASRLQSQTLGLTPLEEALRERVQTWIIRRP
jgi:hypothetical protein